LNILVVTLVVFTGSQAALAQQPPTAGGQLQQIPPTPVTPRSSPDVRIDQAPQAATPDAVAGPSLIISMLHISGASQFSESELLNVCGFRPGVAVTLNDLRAMAARITTFYNSRGYLLARAYVPAQPVADGSVSIAVIEGRYGKISLNNQTYLKDRTANGVLDGLASNGVVETAPLERRLLLLSDVPGVAIRSTLSPGAAVGTSDLLVDLVPSRTISGNLEADNAGNRYTGAYRAGGTINLNNPFGIGDVLSLRMLTSFDGFIYGRASYQALVGKTTVGVGYAHIGYKLGREFSGLEASGTADIASVYASYPLIRSRVRNLYLLGDAEAKWFVDTLGYIPSTGRRRTQVGSIGISGDSHDAFGGGGWDTYAASVSFGSLDIRGPTERAFDAVTARANGGFGTAQLAYSRLQTVAGPFLVYGSIRGQVAFNNLDISEKIELGGAYAVRAYPEGEAYGDQGYVATIEPRLRLSRVLPGIPGDLQLFGLVDFGEVDYAKNPWLAGSNHARRSAYGGGLSWAAPAGFFLKATYASKLGSERATSAPDEPGRFWFQIVKTF
jgi:hemolysin activation/secretion protein